MTEQQLYDDFCAREEGAPYAERRGEVSAFWPMFGLPITPGAVRSEELWIQGGENGMQWPGAELIVAIDAVRARHSKALSIEMMARRTFGHTLNFQSTLLPLASL